MMSLLLTFVSLAGVVAAAGMVLARCADRIAELTRLGRSGVPVYAVYTPGAAGPRLLSEILSVDEVRGAFAAPN